MLGISLAGSIDQQSLHPAQAAFVTDLATFVTVPAAFATEPASFVTDVASFCNRPNNLCNSPSNLCNRTSNHCTATIVTHSATTHQSFQQTQQPLQQSQQPLQPVQAAFVTDPVWAARYNTWLLVNLTPKGGVCSVLSFSNRPSDCFAGLACEDHSLCNGRNKLCIARGPAWPDNFRSNEIIAQRQADKARDLLTSATEEVSGDPRV